MFAIAKFLHFFALMLGAAGGLGNMAIAIAARRLNGPPPAALQSLRPFFAWAGLIGIILIWITGLWLYFDRYGGATLGASFQAKLVAALAILLTSIAATILRIRAAKTGAPPPSWLPMLAHLNAALLLAAVALAVYVFTSAAASAVSD